MAGSIGYGWIIYMAIGIAFFIYMNFVILGWICMFSLYSILSIFGVGLYALIYFCCVQIKGYFVESCNPDCNTKDKNKDFTFIGNHTFTTYESIEYTFMKYTLWYFAIYAIILFFITHKFFGSNSIFPYLLLIGGCLFKLYKHFYYKTITNPPSITSRGGLIQIMNKNLPFGEAVFSYLSSYLKKK